MRADNLSGLPGFRWFTDLVCFLHPERGTWAEGRWGGRMSERTEARCGVPWSPCSASFPKEET